VPLVPILGILVCGGMIIALDVNTLKVALIWMIVGIVIYYFYGMKNSVVRKNGE
jgi:basic amino acid/polyamine antiporter, APA family